MTFLSKMKRFAARGFGLGRTSAAVSARAARRPRRPSLSVEGLEDRFAPAVYNVIGTGDGLGSVLPTHTPGVFNATTLRAAITAADANPGGNTINLTVGGTYSLTQGELAILPGGGNLTVQDTSGKTVTINANHQSRVFDINPNFDPANPTPAFTVTLTGLTITGGLASDAANPDGPNASGGGIRDVGNASLTLNNDVVTGNTATADGGGVVMENTVSVPWTLTVNNSVISNNHAGDAGGGIDADGAGKVFVNPGTVISGNTSVNQGAGIWLDAIQANGVFQTANLSVYGVLISGNEALAAGNVGGGIGNAGNGSVTITNSTIANNFSNGVGGGFGDENGGGNLTVVNSLFLGNIAATEGGAIEASGPSTTITTSELKANESGMDGGGLFVTSPTVTVKSSTVANNIAAGDGNGLGGGGIELQTTGTATILTSTITGNVALNNAGANGGGIEAPAAFTGTLTLQNDTINANLAANGGGLFWAGNGKVALQNTIVAQNFVTQGGVGPDADSSGVNFTDLGGNLIGLGGPANGNSGLGNPFAGLGSTQVGTSAAINALLAALGNYCGPVVGAPGAAILLEAEPLLAGSPALGKGVVNGAPTTNEIGQSSVVKGKVNIGAV
jgi:hypothetical protein